MNTFCQLWLFVCCKTKSQNKLFFEKENICFLKNIYYLQEKNLFTWKENFMQKKTITEKKNFPEKKLCKQYLIWEIYFYAKNICYKQKDITILII